MDDPGGLTLSPPVIRWPSCLGGGHRIQIEFINKSGGSSVCQIEVKCACHTVDLKHD